MFKNLIPKSLKRLYHFGWALLSIIIFGRPSKKLKVIGVTGTDGKTTTTTLLYSILKESGQKVAMINGLNYALPSKEWKNHSDNSTPGKFEIRKFLKQAVKENCETVILEVTSWGIQQYRVYGIAFDVAVFTNFSYEHLDLHGSLRRYRKMKGKLFKYLYKSYRKNGQAKVAVVNKDDKNYEYFASFPKDKLFDYSITQEATVQAIKNDDYKDSSFQLKFGNQIKPVKLALKGDFNISNALAAATAALSVGVTLDAVVQGLEKVDTVPGRMEFIKKGQPFYLIVDFAHTPNGFRSLFLEARELVGKDHKIIAVYGATGGRDRGRRSMVGKVAGELIDFSVLTSEDPRTEDPEKIAQEIAVGLKKRNKHFSKDYNFIKDRAEAIQYACKIAQPGDAVLLCSMGDYDVMYVGTGKVEWSDRGEAKKALKSFGY